MQRFRIFSEGSCASPRITWDTLHTRGLHHPPSLSGTHCARESTLWFVANLICKDAGRLSRGAATKYRRRQNTPRLCILLICRRSTYLILLSVAFDPHGTVNLPIGIQGIHCSCRFFIPKGFQNSVVTDYETAIHIAHTVRIFRHTRTGYE